MTRMLLVTLAVSTSVIRMAHAACPPGADTDADGYCSGFGIARDCVDDDALINPNVQEVVANGTDEDCDGHDALNRRLLMTSFAPLTWPATGVVSRSGPFYTNVTVGDGTAAGSVSRALTQLIRTGKVWLVVDVSATSVTTLSPPCSVSVSTTPWPLGPTTTATRSVTSAGTHVLGPLAVTDPPRSLTDVTLTCPAGRSMTVEWASAQNTGDVFPPARETDMVWEDVDMPGGGLTTTVIARATDAAKEGTLFAGSDVGGVAMKDPWAAVDEPWRTVNGTAPDGLIHQPAVGVADVLPSPWGRVYALTGRVLGSGLAGGLWVSDDDGETWYELANTEVENVGGYAKYSECGNSAHGGGKLLVPESGIESVYIGNGDEDALGVALWDWDLAVCELPVSGAALPSGYVGALARVESETSGLQALLVGYRGRGASQDALYLCSLPADSTDLDGDADEAEVGLSCSVGAATCAVVTAGEGLDVRDLEVDPLFPWLVYLADGGDDPEATSCANHCGGVYAVSVDDDGSGNLSASLSSELSYGAFECTAGSDYLDVTGVSMDPDGDVLLAFVPTTHDKGYTYDRIYRILGSDIGSGFASDWIELNQDTSADRLARQAALDGSGAWLEAATVAVPTQYPEYHAPGNAYDAIWFDGWDPPSTGDWYAAVMTEFQMWKVEGLDDTTPGWDPEDDTTWTFWPELTDGGAHQEAWQTTVANDVELDGAGNLWVTVSDLGLFQLPSDAPAAELDCLWDFLNAGGERVSVGLDDSVWVSFYDQGSNAIPHELGIFRTVDGGNSWEYQGAGITNTNARNIPPGGLNQPWCKGDATDGHGHQAEPFGGADPGHPERGFAFNGGLTDDDEESWGNPIALAAINSAAAVAGFQSYTYNGGVDTVDGRLAYTIDGGVTWVEIPFDGDWAPADPYNVDCVAYDFFEKLKGVSLVHRGDALYSYADDADESGAINDAEGWAFDLFVASRDPDAEAGRDGHCGLARVRVDGGGSTWEWFDLSAVEDECGVGEDNMRVVATSPWSDEVYIGGFYSYDAGAHRGGVCVIDIDDPEDVVDLIDPSDRQYAIGDIVPHPNVSDLVLVTPLLDADAWVQCMKPGAGACPDVPYPMLLERADGSWTQTALSTVAPPSLVSTEAGWTPLVGAESSILYATEGGGVWVGTVAW